MRHAVLTLIVVPAFILVSAAQGSHAFDLPDEAFRLIAEANADPCSICAKQKLREAFAIMNARLEPGQIVNFDMGCALMKRNPQDGYEFSLACYPSAGLRRSVTEGQMVPDLVFAFYTPEKRLVGIADEDCTRAETADVFRAAPAGTVFEGRVRLIQYAYGDGPVFNYFPAAGRVRVHCVVLELRPASQQDPRAGWPSPPPRVP